MRETLFESETVTIERKKGPNGKIGLTGRNHEVQNTITTLATEENLDEKVEELIEKTKNLKAPQNLTQKLEQIEQVSIIRIRD